MSNYTEKGRFVATAGKLIAAAEYIRKQGERQLRECADELADDPEMLEIINGHMACAEHILSTVRPNDDDPPEFYRIYDANPDKGILRCQVSVSGVNRTGVYLTRWDARNPNANVNDLWICDVETNRQLRAVLTSLGIPDKNV